MKRLSTEELQTLKSQAMIAEKGGERFSVRLAVTGGNLGAADLRTIATIADRFGAGSVHLTTRQGVEISHVPFDNLAPLRVALEEAGLKLAATGRCVRGIVACPGSSCPRGLIDSQGLAQRLRARVGGRSGLPHKFKIAVSGCPHGCTKPRENDLGVMGQGKAFVVFVGGKMGLEPRWGDQLPLTIRDESQLFVVVDSVIDWFAAHGQPGERFGATIERVGLEKLIEYLGRVDATATRD
jgi:dissimilatory sulfite reductase (desulfoviridin) alpha/beta subunit